MEERDKIESTEDEKLYSIWLEGESKSGGSPLLDFSQLKRCWLAAKEAYTASCILLLHQEAETMSREAAKMVFEAVDNCWENNPFDDAQTQVFNWKKYEAERRRLTGGL